MLKGICILPVIPMRKTKSDKSEMINQILFGETFQIIKKMKDWSHVALSHDGYEGWIDNKQYETLRQKNYRYIIYNKKVASIKLANVNQSIIMGSFVPQNKEIIKEFDISHDLSFFTMLPFEKWFIKIAQSYINTPYLWGGRTEFGIDCSGYTQMVYRFFNLKLPRDASQQANTGIEISNLKNAKLGDLVFFGNKKTITHVGIYLGNNQIIHASGKVRIDKLDARGILNTKNLKYTHTFQTIKRII